MKLIDWVETLGTHEVSKLLRVNPSTVSHWRRGYVLPNDEKKLRIKKLSRGAVTFDEMIEPHFSRTNKNRWNK